MLFHTVLPEEWEFCGVMETLGVPEASALTASGLWVPSPAGWGLELCPHLHAWTAEPGVSFPMAPLCQPQQMSDLQGTVSPAMGRAPYWVRVGEGLHRHSAFQMHVAASGGSTATSKLCPTPPRDRAQYGS